MTQNRKKLIMAAAAFVVALAVFCVVLRGLKKSPSAAAQPFDPQALALSETNTRVAIATTAPSGAGLNQPTIQSTKAEPTPTPATPRTAKELVAEILEISSTEGPITADKAEKFKRNLEELIKQGAASIPAIRELLDKRVEYDYADIIGGEQIGYASLRASLLDALRQIDGPEAQEAMVEVLHTSALPAELLAIANNLDQEAPGQYREQIVYAARESIAMAATNPAAANIELGPAFRILQNYGDANTTVDTAKNEPANFNNAVDLANMPDGQGLGALVQMAQNPSSASGQTIATEMIAQMAAKNNKAADALMQMAQSRQISNSIWEKLAPILGGDQYAIGNSSTQSPNDAQYSGVTLINNATTSDEINQRIALIDQFLGTVPSDSAAAASLRNQRTILSGKLGK